MSTQRDPFASVYAPTSKIDHIPQVVLEKGKELLCVITLPSR
jgi:hypothetical protein